ncbi:MAG: hypothetical protein LUC50_06220 [Ruminococcus sp.]|nr:hypothetical protein [Ruminococcus sp.]
MRRNEKKTRQDALLRLVMQEEIATQNDLRQRMMELGFSVTQATLSRDIHELKLVKDRRGGRVCYTVSVQEELPVSVSDMVKSTSLRTNFAGNIAVIHCRSGTAPAVCVSLDALHREDVVGTIAGDDTVFVLLHTEQQARDFAISFAKSIETGGI